MSESLKVTATGRWSAARSEKPAGENVEPLDQGIDS
jgi:hypothetical protein